MDSIGLSRQIKITSGAQSSAMEDPLQFYPRRG
jgi:hypothetical protein